MITRTYRYSHKTGTDTHVYWGQGETISLSLASGKLTLTDNEYRELGMPDEVHTDITPHNSVPPTQTRMVD